MTSSFQMKKKSEAYLFIEALVITLLVLIVIWGVHLLNDYLDYDLNRFGLHPKSIEGILGIFTMPFLHSGQSFDHILNNSLAVLVMLTTLIYIYRKIALKVVLLSWVLTGLLAFFLAKTGTNHIGISGLTYSWVTFIFVSGVLRWDRMLTGVSLAMVVLYGGLFWGIFPMEKGISWEGHLAGAVVGILLGLLFRNSPPQPRKLTYEKLEELGVEPEEKYWEHGYFERKRAEELAKLKQEQEARQSIKITYHIKEKNDEIKP